MKSLPIPRSASPHDGTLTPALTPLNPLELPNYTSARGRGTLKHIALLLAVALLASCAPQQTNDGYRVETADITYGPNDQRDQEWRALMKAMDSCHAGGFTDAQLDHKPETRCIEGGPGGCTRYAAHLAYDCIGMGYQSN